VALDILSDSPQLGAYVERYGDHIPVWVPFAHWTKLIDSSQGRIPSLKDVMMQWLHSWNEDELWSLFQLAFDDGRLLLLIDGIDEWVTQPAAELALDLLKSFVQQLDVPCIATSRPHGFSQVGGQVLGWQIGELAGLSREQQVKLATIWFTDRLELGNADRSADATAQPYVDELLSELDRSPDLADLAKIPLLFLLLIVLKLVNVSLPHSRFQAYERLINHLINIHPRGRRKAALLLSEGDVSLSDDDVQVVLARLAFEIHSRYGNGQIATNDAMEVVSSFLKKMIVKVSALDIAKLGRQLKEFYRVARVMSAFSFGGLRSIWHFFIDHSKSICAVTTFQVKMKPSAINSCKPIAPMQSGTRSFSH